MQTSKPRPRPTLKCLNLLKCFSSTFGLQTSHFMNGGIQVNNFEGKNPRFHWCCEKEHFNLNKIPLINFNLDFIVKQLLKFGLFTKRTINVTYNIKN